jgi:hypothetical protein
MTFTIIITPTTPPITPPYRTLGEDSWIAEIIRKKYFYMRKQLLTGGRVLNRLMLKTLRENDYKRTFITYSLYKRIM